MNSPVIGLLAAVWTAVMFVCPPAVAADGGPQDDAVRAQELLARAEALIGERKLDEALEAARESLAIRERTLGPDHPFVATSLNIVGVVLYLKGDHAGAELPLARALEIRRRAPGISHAELSESLNNLASIIRAQGRLAEAEPLVVEALAVLLRHETDPVTLGRAHNNVGLLSRDRGDFRRAQEHLEKAAELWRKAYPPDHPALGTVANNLGLVWQALGDLPKAEASFRESLPIREKAGNPENLALTLNNLASVLQEDGRLDEAEPLYGRAIALYEEAVGAEHPSLGQALSNFAVLHLLRKDYDRAGPLYRRALAIREKALGPVHQDVAISLAAYAIFLHNTGEYAEAVRTQSRAAGVIERNLALVLETGSESQKEDYLRQFRDSIDITLWMRSAARPANAEADRAALVTLLRRKGRIQDVLAASTDALRAGASAGGSADLEELGRVRANLASLALEPASTPERDSRMKELETRAETLEAKLSARSAGLGRTPVDLDVADLQRVIPDDGVFLDFFRYRPFDPHATRVAERFGEARYAAYALRPKGDPVWIEFGESRTIDALIHDLRRALEAPGRGDLADRTRALAEPLTGPLMRVIESASQVLVSPDADLNLLPFHVLAGREGRLLIETHRFSYLTSGRDLLAPPSSHAAGPSLVVANPAFGEPGPPAGRVVPRTFGPLPGAEREAISVAELLGNARMLLGAEASEAAVKAARSPRILHVATHGFYLAGGSDGPGDRIRGLRVKADDSPSMLHPLLRSGLALAGANAVAQAGAEDGILTASEAALLDLRGTELVFVSACESGLGVVSAGESVYGLRRAFAIAGARSQILTLWKVSDEATTQLVTDFYRSLAQGETRAGALRAAQRAALDDPARRHPFFWAAFILSGADGPLALDPR
jgi:CHAT domain-containing protein/Flp pilus assembly protein TadD